jgi:hypothetical protein
MTYFILIPCTIPVSSAPQQAAQCVEWYSCKDTLLVQVLEGPAQAVHALYAGIRRDKRHTQAKVGNLAKPQTPIADPHLLKLLDQFRKS